MVSRIAAVALLLAGCSELHAEPADPADPAQPTLADALKAAQQRMHQRFAAVHVIEQGIVASDLAQTRGAARQIADLDEPAILPSWKPYIDGVRSAARQVSEARDIQSAARLSAELGQRCASCHSAINAQIPLPRVAAPAAGARLVNRMISHQWAAARMWEGLVAPNDERWRVGATTLASAPLAIVAESASLGIADDVARVRLLATRAARPGADRAGVYGELLAVCAHCHAVIRDR